MPVLTLLDGVRWHGEPIPGDRPAALLAVLALHPGGLSDQRIVDQVWPDDPPVRPTKALQVLVSRIRGSCGPDSIIRSDSGYRLGAPPDEVDALLLGRLVDAATRALGRGDASGAVTHARRALEVAGTRTSAEYDGPLAELRSAAGERRAEAERVLALAHGRGGDHAAALPLLLRSHKGRPDDETVLEALLRSEAAEAGAAAALDRYERYRDRLAARLGADPGPPLQRLHAELLVSDRPVRQGVHFDASSLLGRDNDLRALRASVRASRVTSIVGAGGLGKTRLAHVLGREAEQPVVHFVELVGIAAPEDLVGEVGSALGVRDSVSGRRRLTPSQRTDVRARIAQQLDQVPSLLILDNCEHVVDGVADLVAFLVATTRDLRVVTTSRAPLAIAAERIYALGQLTGLDGAELFRQRAAAARPDVGLDGAERTIAEIVDRLDGLPLAIELAAAKTRVMSVTDIARRLENRFSLLRGGDRAAPDRHQTLLAVIDWSWNLLDDDERQALRWLSVFHDGFTLDAAEHVLGDNALESLATLADQSLLVVTEPAGGTRYRMLETVREFGRMHLVDAGEDIPARTAQRSWAVRYAHAAFWALLGVDQVSGMDRVRAEETNLADVLRQTLTEPDPESAMVLLAALGQFWSIGGDHARLIMLLAPVEQLVTGWEPPDDIADETRAALAATLSNAGIADHLDPAACRALLTRLGPGKGDPRVRAFVTVILSVELTDDAGSALRLEQLCDGPDRMTAVLALQFRSHILENTGDVAAAIDSAARALELGRPEDGPWTAAILHTMLAQMHAQLGHTGDADRHAREAIPVLDRLKATDDAIQVRSVLAMAHLRRGEVDATRRCLDEITQIEERHHVFGGAIGVLVGRAELALAVGDPQEGLRLHREAVEHLRHLRFPGMAELSGVEPWVLFGETAALGAYAMFGEGDDGNDLFALLRSKLPWVLDPDRPFLDYPVAGMVLFGLGSWCLLRRAGPPDEAVRLLVLADRFAYNRFFPSMDWERVTGLAEEIAPGCLQRVAEEYAGRRGPELLTEARRAVTAALGGS